MLSGTGYSYEKPILYYSRSLMLELGYDVIQINYSFEQQLFEQKPQAISNRVYSVVDPIVEYFLETKPYTNAVYIGIRHLAYYRLLYATVFFNAYSVCTLNTIVVTGTYNG